MLNHDREFNFRIWRNSNKSYKIQVFECDGKFFFSLYNIIQILEMPLKKHCVGINKVLY